MSEDNTSILEIKGYPVCYEIFGSGQKPVLFIPDVLGTGRTDFPEQLQGEYALDKDKFSIIAVESPGWGRSRPPERKYGASVYANDCEIFYQLMQQLGYEKYSVLGFGDGAKAAILMAIKYKDEIQLLVVSGASIYSKPLVVKYMNSIKTIDKWNEERVETLLKVYGTQDLIQELWTKFLKFYGYYDQYFPNDFCNTQYKSIDCPVLVIHGDQDPMTDLDQAKYLSNTIKMGKLHRFPTGKHNLHTRNAKAFKDLVEPHLLKYTLSEEWTLNDLKSIELI